MVVAASARPVVEERRDQQTEYPRKRNYRCKRKVRKEDEKREWKIVEKDNIVDDREKQNGGTQGDERFYRRF